MTCQYSVAARPQASERERHDGIGYNRPDPFAIDSINAWSYRREASAMRSRAYALPRGKSGCYDLWLAAQTFAPGSDPLPILASDTWTEDDEPRHPLPIRYQPSFTIG